MRTELNAILAISYRDLLKLLRDPARIVSTLIFPILIVAVLGGSMQASLGRSVGFDFLTATLTGMFAQTLFQSTALGVISLIEDRENDFSQEMFVSPVSRYSIIFGKVLGETLVALPQGLAVLLFGFLIGIPISLFQVLLLLPVGVAVCLFGGAFGVLILANLPNPRAANQIFPFVMLPQFLIAGVFAPVQSLPFYLEVLSRISPLRYAVDLVRGVFYIGHPDYPKVVLESPLFNLSVLALGFALFLVVGTLLFVRGERNR